MKSIEEFCGQTNGYSRSITLRNKLIPVGKTEENIKKFEILDKDIKRASAYNEVKELIDDFHRFFIEDILSKTSLVWGPLYDQFDLFQNEKDKQKKNKEKKEVEKLLEVMREKISDKFKKNENFKKLFSKELLTELIPNVIKNDNTGTISDKKATIDIFNKFVTYFNGFHQNRKNMYEKEANATSISNRIVNENFPRFYANVKFFEYLQKEFPEIISESEKSLSDILQGKNLKDIFSSEGFNEVLSQKGIDFYNTLIGGITKENSKKVQGLNEKINLERQQLPVEKKSKLKQKMVVLYKQILSDKNTASFIPKGFESSEEVYKSIKQFKEQSLNKVIDAIKKISEKSDYDLNKIYVPSNEVTNFSLKLFGNWSILSEGLFLIEKDSVKKNLTEKKIEVIKNEISKKDFSLFELQNAYERWAKENDVVIEKTVKNYFKIIELRVNDKTKEKKFVDILEKLEKTFNLIDFEKEENLIKEKESAIPIKEFLDEAQNLYHYLKLVDYRGQEQKDSEFYYKYDEILLLISEIIPLYNKVRNFVTRKPNEVKKIKLNFGCPTLANGWDFNKETSNNAIILRSGPNYYLGIFNPKDKPKFDKSFSSGNYYEKMIYKLLPGANKMLPKVFFSKKGQETFLPPKEILLGYEEGKHTKGNNFDKAFMHKLIDWFKDAINRHEDWKNFNFKFSPTSSYEDLSSFYKEIETQGYKITFQKISESYIDSLVDSGKLFLFQIYNKDYSTGKDGGNGSTGKKNLHTLYWENLFSEENLKDVCLKLNGEAEIFWRDINPNIKSVCHKKGSILVNKTTSDGKSIPEEIYQEIYKYKNPEKQEKNFTISKEAKILLDSGTVICKTAKFDIVKDKHFTKSTYLFHCPITMNFKAPEITGKKFNDKVQEFLKNNPDIKIIGLDRGERHLIYLSLINQKGEIELQKTLNLVEQVHNNKKVSVNYHEKLVQKETERDKARKNWQSINNIKDLKEGYLSNIIHEIAKLMVENNAIVVMENLNFGFKRGRFAVERQVYQKFENMLIEKLNYLVFKDKESEKMGGVLKAFQLANKVENVMDENKQCGWIFYIPAAYTSKIDPKTGFSNLFYTAGLTNIEKKKDFFDKFDSIRYDKKNNCFVFSFDYSKFSKNADYKKRWDIYSFGERLIFSKKEKTVIPVDPTQNLKTLFDNQQITWASENNLIEQIRAVEAKRENCSFYDNLYL